MDEHEPTPVDPEEAARALKRELNPAPKREPKPEPRRARFRTAQKPATPAAVPEPPISTHPLQEVYSRNWWWAFLLTFFFSFFSMGVFLLLGLYGIAGKFEYEHFAGRGKLRGALVGMALNLVLIAGIYIWIDIHEQARLAEEFRSAEAREQALADVRDRSQLLDKEIEAKRLEIRAAEAEARAAREARQREEDARRRARATDPFNRPAPANAAALEARAQADQEATAQMPDWQERERIRLEEQVKAREEKRIIDARLKEAAEKREVESEIAKLQALRQDKKTLLRRKDELAEELPKAQRAPRAYELQLNSAKDPDFRANLMRKQQEAHDRLRALEQEEGQLVPKLATLERQILEARDRIVVLGGVVPADSGSAGGAPKVAMVLELKDGSVVEAQRAILLNRIWHVKLMDGKEQQIVEEEIASTRKP